jgi:hypothetical protein
MIENINRREFLKKAFLYPAGAYCLLGNGFIRDLPMTQKRQGTEKLGRVLYDDINSHVLPSSESKAVDNYSFNDLVPYEQEISVKNGLSKNEIWVQLPDSNYMLYKHLQPVEERLNEVISDISTSGQLAEVTVPYTNAVMNKWDGQHQENEDQIFFYGSTHWVYGLGKDEDGGLYYLVKEDRWDDSYYVNATHMRLIGDDELEPISANIDDSRKSIRISLRDQYLVAYQDNEPVLISALSSGQLSGDVDLTTPTGDFFINYKRPSRHMVHSDRIGINDNELYGVPWVSYFTDSGIALHGTYWHNDFSQPNSHGCINLPIPTARWLYLWTMPTVPPREKKYVSNRGTSVEIY